MNAIDVEKKYNSLYPEKKLIIEWYDDIIIALIQFKGDQDWFLISLQALNSEGLKVYTLIRLESNMCQKIISMFTDKPSWPIWIPKKMNDSTHSILIEYLDLLYKQQSTNIFLALTEKIDNGIQLIKNQSIRKEIKVKSMGQIMNMEESERKGWFNFF